MRPGACLSPLRRVVYVSWVRIRSYLLLLAALVLVPGFVAATIAVERLRESEREVALHGLSETARATALLVDGQIQRSMGALAVLANSSQLQAEDFAGFYTLAQSIDQPPDVWTLLVDENGVQIVNTRVPFGTPLPSVTVKDEVDEVLAQQRPLVSGVFRGPASGTLLTRIYVPAKPTPTGRRYVVAQSISVEHWKKTAVRPQVDSDWVVAVIDREGRFISRSHHTEQRVGKQARPELVAAAGAADEGLIRHATLEGTDSFDAFTHSPLTGWSVAVAAPVAAVEASANKAVIFLGAGVAMALVAALLSASTLSRRLIRAMDGVSSAAAALGRGESPPPVGTSIREVNALDVAFAEAGALLHSEKRARERVEAERAGLLENERRAREAAQAENSAKDQFLALLGHELRNPLSAIAGATEVLARTDDPKTARYLAILRRQNRHLKHIVDDLLEVSRMLSGKIVLDAAPLDLAACVSSCVEALATSEAAKGHTLTTDVTEVWVHADPVRIEQIVNNLVTNAIKFSPLGSAVTIRVAPDAARDRAVLEVSDAGAGIDPALVSKIFEPFVQGPPVEGRAASGLGIGLALVKQLVVLHGGEVSVRSGAGSVGATFEVTFPRVATDGVAAKEAPSSLHTRASTQTGVTCRVLLVEDNPDAREATAALLRSMGYDTTVAENGEAGLVAAVARRPDIIVMDIGLPGRDGLTIAAEMRRTTGLVDVPLIALSGYGQASDRRASAQAGFDVHLVKPVESGALLQAIESQRRRGASQRPS